MPTYPAQLFADYERSLRMYLSDISTLERINDESLTIDDKDTVFNILDALHKIFKQESHRLYVDAEIVPDVMEVDSPPRAPFPQMVIVAEHIGEHEGDDITSVLTVIEYEEERRTAIYEFIGFTEKRIYIPSAVVGMFEWDADTFAYAVLPGFSVSDDRRKELNDEVTPMLYLYRDICEMINCANIGIDTVEPSSLRKMRAKKKGDMLEAYHVIKLPHASTRRTKDGCGHHASPTMHKRRGHYRRLPSDHSKRTWVRPCIVGQLENGVTLSDYAVKK